MGEVWRARDLVLGRPVAVKLLRPGFAANAEGLARFRAARLVAMIFPAVVGMTLPVMRVHTVLSPRVPAYRCPDLGGCGLWLRRRRRWRGR